jgi:hypothetical protein
MIARHRGDARIHSRWAPGAIPRTPAPETRAQADQHHKRELNELAVLDRPDGRRRRPAYLIPQRRWWALVGIVAVLGVALIATQQDAGQPMQLPSTPQQWVEQWTAASIDNPGRVCRQLFAPALAAVFKADTGRSCLDYYDDVNAKSFRIRHILVDGYAAAVEVREVGMKPNWGYVTMLLGHGGRGWRAVDIVPGGPVRPR